MRTVFGCALLFFSPVGARFAALGTGFEWAEPLIQIGISGAVLFWFMMRAEGLLKKLAYSVDRMARAQLLLLIASEVAGQIAKEEAKDLLKDMDDENRR
jgi:hypothetical protein